MLAMCGRRVHSTTIIQAKTAHSDVSAYGRLIGIMYGLLNGTIANDLK